MLKTYYLAKIIHKLYIPSFNKCDIDKTAKVSSGSALAKVKMGRYSYIGGSCSVTDAEIGNFCSIGGKCSIGGGVHPMDAVSTSPVFLKGRNFLRKNFANIPYEPSEKVVIGNDVWIGSGVYIKGGVKIGTGAVIGAHAVVTRDVEPYSVVAGIPAKEIKKRFDEETINQLLEIKWWEWPDEKLKEMSKYFDDPKKLIEIVINK